MTAGEPRAMVVAGVMSGTSADGVDVALVRVSPGVDTPGLEVIGHRGFGFEPEVRAAVMRAMDAGAISVAELSRLHWRLGAVYADCVERACGELGVAAELVGMHGQTVYHGAEAEEFAGAKVRATWQMGEAAVVRERCGVPVVSDFRPADLAAGGQGAPLVPMLDFCVFRSATVGRVLLNLGGIANVTVLPAGCGLGDVVAFDTGPANMVMDALMERAFGRAYDEGGAEAGRGRAVMAVVDELMGAEWFRREAPKSCGREEFGARYADRLVALSDGASGADLVATGAELTVRSVAEAVRRFGMEELIVAGGGVRNGYVMRRLGEELPGMRVRTADEFGVGAQAKEAVAFALLGWMTWFGMAGNVSSATGARGGRVLGKVSF